MTNDECNCGEESSRGCHGVRDGEVYSEYYCDKCYNRLKALKYKEERYDQSA